MRFKTLINSYILIVFVTLSPNILSDVYNDNSIAFLGDNDKDGKLQVCVSAQANVSCITNHEEGVDKLWKLFPPYIAYLVKDGNKSTIYFLNARTGINAKKLSVTSYAGKHEFWLSPGGDRVVSIEQAPFGNLLVSQGVFLDDSHTIVEKVQSGTSLVGWAYPADVIYLHNQKAIIAFVLDKKESNNVVYSVDDNKNKILDAAVSFNGSAYVISVDYDGEHVLELINGDKRKVITREKNVYSPFVSDNAQEVLYITKEKKLNSIYIYDVVSGNAAKYLTVDYEINYPILLR